jgi:hypothetical protein
VLALATLTGFALFMSEHAIGEFRGTLAFGTVTNTPLQTPLWVPQVFWVLGTCFFALTALVMTVHGILLIVGPRRRGRTPLRPADRRGGARGIPARRHRRRPRAERTTEMIGIEGCAIGFVLLLCCCSSAFTSPRRSSPSPRSAPGGSSGPPCSSPSAR